MSVDHAQEHLFKSVFEASIDAIFVINNRGVIQEVNQAGLDLFGYSKNELLQQKVNMLMPEPQHSEHDSYLRKYQETKVAKIIGIGREVNGLKRSGEKFPIRLAVSEFFSGDNVYYTGVIHDLSIEHAIREELHEYSEKLEEKVRRRTKSLEKEVKLKEDAEQALKNSQRLYEEIAMNFPNGTITVLDQNFCIVFIEGTELRDSGYQTSKLLGQNYIELLPEEVRAECIQYFEAALKGKHSVFEIEHDQKVYLARSVPLNPEGEQIMQILHVEINISAQKKAEEEIYKALRKEKELNELKSKFVSLASHEFRTPLSSILSSAALIGKYELEADQHKRQRHIQKIRTNVQNMNIILNDFLSLEKIETGLIKNKAQQLNIKELIEEIVEETSTLKKAGQMLSTHFHHKQNLWKLDPFLLRNILNNLLSNAFKYSSESSEVQLITHEDPNLRIEVIDGGIGISEEDQKQLFNRFFRAENALNTEGTGLGLSIVKRYAELMNAEISFESELNKGSSFKIKFT